MKNKVSAKCFSHFLVLTTGLLILFSSFAGKAQNNSVVSLSGTEWSNIAVPILNPYDSSSTTDNWKYIFDKQGSVKVTHIINKTAGQTQMQMYNWRTNQLELQYVRVEPVINSDIKEGTYKISSKNIFIDHPNFTINAVVGDDAMKGTLTYKGSSQKEIWLITKVGKSTQTTSTNNSDGNNLSPAKTTTQLDEFIESGTSVGSGTFSTVTTPAGSSDFGTEMDPVKAKAKAMRIKEETERKNAEAERKKAEVEQLFIGGWKHLEVAPNSNWINKEVIINFSKNGSATSSNRNFTSAITVNWKWLYTPENDSSGVMELFIDNKLVEKASVKWISKNQFEYRITYVNYGITQGWGVSNFIGDKFAFNRQ